LLFFRKNNF